MAAARTRRGGLMAALLLLVLTASAALVGGETILRSGVVPHTPYSRCGAKDEEEGDVECLGARRGDGWHLTHVERC
jgi:hypothetical protein